MQTEVYHKMSYVEFDKLVNDYFPKADFNFVADEEINNDSTKDFGLVSANSFTEDSFVATDFLDVIIGRLKTICRSRFFLYFFVHMEILPEGNYLIDVSW